MHKHGMQTTPIKNKKTGQRNYTLSSQQLKEDQN